MPTPSTLSSLPQSAPASSVRRVTEVVQTIEGLGLDICIAGDKAALHISTRKGRVLVLLPRAQAVDKFSAGVDSNGVPFASGAEGVMERLVKDAEFTAPKGDEAAPSPRRARGETTAICRTVYEKLVANPHQNVAQLAEAHGIKAGTFTAWMNDNHPGGVGALRDRHIHVPRAMGLAAQAAKGLPLPKPSATSL